MNNHTEGPWYVEDVEQSDCLLVTDCQSVSVATVWRQPLDPPEWCDSNAALIAAAPDLLAALETLRDAKRISTQELRRTADRILDDAIAKARGSNA